jgi:hypothetical protein
MPLFEQRTRHRIWIMTTNLTALYNVGTVLVTGNNSGSFGLALCNCLRGLCVHFFVWIVSHQFATWCWRTIARFLLQLACSASENRELSNWSSLFTVSLHLPVNYWLQIGFLTSANVLKRFPTSDVRGKDFWLLGLFEMGLWVCDMCLEWIANPFRADSGGLVVQGMDLRPLDWWDRGFGFRWGHIYSLVFVVRFTG